MANVSASFLGYAYYNNGWNPSTDTVSDFYTTSANYGMPITGKNNYWRYLRNQPLSHFHPEVYRL